MSNDQITFSCTSCGVELNVPLSYAGISGPCPGCQAPITAPAPESEQPPTPAAPPQEQAIPEPSSPSPVAAIPSPAAPPSPAAVPSPPATPAPSPQQPLSAPATAILAAAPAQAKMPTSAPSPAVVPASETPASVPAAAVPAPAQSSPPPAALSNESPAIPDFSIPSVAPQSEEAPVAKDKFPSVPSTPNNPSAAKTVLPPRRAEVELPAPLAQPNSAPFPSTLIPPTSIPANQARPAGIAEPTIREVPSQEEVPVLEQRAELTREVTPPPEPVTPAKPTNPAPAFLGGNPSPAAPPATSVPQAEPQSGSTAYPVPQPSAPAPVPTAYPTATPAPQAPPASTPAAPVPAQTAPPQAAPAGPTAPAAPSATPAETTTAPPVSHGLSTFSAPPKEAPAKEEIKQKKPKGKLWWLRIVIPILFLALCGLVVYLVTDLLQKVANDGSENRQLNVPSAPNATARQEAKERVAINDPTVGETNFSNTPSRLDPVSAEIASEDSPKLYVEGEPPPTTSSRPKKKSTSTTDLDPSDAASVLDRFLNANTLEERLPLLSRSKRSEKELIESSLAHPFPEVLHSRLLHYMVNNAERHTEHFFEVSFQKELGERPYPILIQINDWGEGQCKIHTDAFLDLFEDRLSQFASKPVQGTRTFHIVADAYKHCFDEIIPDWDKKSFLKLRNHPRMSPRLIAYFNRNSQMAEEISRPDSLPWGESGICTVTVAWNMENPENPFVELIDVVGFTWEP